MSKRQQVDGLPQVRDLTVGTMIPVNVIKRVVEGQVMLLPVEELHFNPENDRILDYIEEFGPPKEGHEDDWYEARLMDEEEGKKLLGSIRRATGHTVPIYVQKLKDRPGYRVWEGNRRRAAYGVLRKSEDPEDRRRFATMTAIVVPEDVTQEEMDLFMVSVGHAGARVEGGGAAQKGWSPASNARVLDRLCNKYYRDYDFISELSGLKKTVVKQKLQAFASLRKVIDAQKDKPQKERIKEPYKIFPSLEELQRKPKLRTFVSEGRFDDFVRIVGTEGKIPDKLRGVRTLAKLVRTDKAAFEELLKPDSTLQTVEQKVLKKHPEIKHKSGASILNSALKWVRGCRVSDLKAFKEDPAHHKVYVALFKELKAKAELADIQLP